MVFYFSATGNSEYVAKEVASALGEETLSITKCMKTNNLTFRENVVGIVTPNYAWGLPSIVNDFLSSLVLEERPEYLFFIATYGTTSGQTGHFANDFMKKMGLSFDSYFSVKMPDTYTPTFNLSNIEKVQKTNEKADKIIEEIIPLLKRRVKGDHMKGKVPLFAAKFFYTHEYDKMRKTSHLSVNSSCIGCGKCAHNCPVNAIQIIDKHPVWVKDQCVMCLSCLHHCPVFAIQYDNKTQHHGQYAHRQKVSPLP